MEVIDDNNTTSLEETTKENMLQNENQTIITEEQGAESYEQLNDLIGFYGEGILLTIVSTFGLIGNIMSIIVLTRSINGRTNCGNPNIGLSVGSTSFSNLLRGLATFDALFLLVRSLSLTICLEVLELQHSSFEQKTSVNENLLGLQRCF